MTIFEAVKSAVTPRMAAEHYGMTVARNGMVCCPFHNDRHPSMKLNEDYFYCFGCGAKGDVIEFTSKLFGITAMEAVQKLRADFGVQEDKPSILTKLNLYRTQADNERLCSAFYGSICKSCRIGRCAFRLGHWRMIRMTALWKPAICLNARSICWIY